jgi:hypothetical protein
MGIDLGVGWKEKKPACGKIRISSLTNSPFLSTNDLFGKSKNLLQPGHYLPDQADQQWWQWIVRVFQSPVCRYGLHIIAHTYGVSQKGQLQ